MRRHIFQRTLLFITACLLSKRTDFFMPWPTSPGNCLSSDVRERQLLSGLMFLICTYLKCVCQSMSPSKSLTTTSGTSKLSKFVVQMDVTSCIPDKKLSLNDLGKER